jgi:hypothetical protein
VESPRSHSGVEKDLCSSAWIMKDGDSRGPRITLDRFVLRESTHRVLDHKDCGSRSWIGEEGPSSRDHTGQGEERTEAYTGGFQSEGSHKRVLDHTKLF